MIQQAGLDLLEYGDNESQIWKRFGSKDISKVDRANNLEFSETRAPELIYGATPADWSLMTCWPPKIRASMLHPPPGAFPKSRNLPTTIIWDPTEEERNEGPWEIAEVRMIPSRYRDLRDVGIELKEAFEELSDGVQDDLGAIMLMQYRASHPQGSASRSHSQPRHMYRRDMVYGKLRSSRRHQWLDVYHLCLFDAQWRLASCCSRADAIRTDWYGHCQNPRSCAKGISAGCHSVQESSSWRHSSYLGDIAQCQEQNPRGDEHGIPRGMRHSYTRSCPQGCGKVHLDRIQVPEALQPYHPTPWRRYRKRI
ncbi:hypothetical protein EV356DRAFT_500539 [Viridothelium virens]|uniref:Uncharacterized protein n=1 Tax=Viridothelium virens TaxID=1048519 RepID=A0A6A6HBW9_VIRVR|nr:hypothetical protein EV356DRAFT_500539 [Viridothelium virens]